MKKKLLLAGAVVMMAAAAVTGYSTYSKTNVSDLLSANVEALTDIETVPAAFAISGICPKCGATITGCLACYEPCLNTCTKPDHKH